MLTVNEIFFSIQGEGTRTGLPCVFVRLTGCPLRCVYCDTAYAFHEGARREEEDVIAEVERFPCRLLLLTGGEPLSQPAAFPFVTTLLDRGWQVLVETSGHVPIGRASTRARWPSWTSRRRDRASRTACTGRTSSACGRRTRSSSSSPTARTTSGRATVVRERALAARGAVLLLARARRARPGRAGALGPGGRPARARPGPAPQVPVARRGARGVTAERPLAVVCVSGGMDSAVTAATAAEAGHDLAFLHANYGQRTEGKELACFHALADHYAARHRLVVDFPVLAAIGGSSLTDRGIPVREGEPRGRTASRPPTCRSATRISSPPPRPGARCSARARSSSAPSGRTPPGYPDCRPEFYAAFEEAIRQGTRPETAIRIETPVIGLTKADIVRRGTALGRALREDLVLLPGGGRGLRRLRVVPVAAQGVRGSGRAGPDSLPRAGLA